MSEFKTPLGRRELDALTLGTEEALLAYKEQRLELQAAARLATSASSRGRRRLSRAPTTKSFKCDVVYVTDFSPGAKHPSAA
jgi:hypothetical protein